MNIKILGPGCKNCKKLMENTEEAVRDLNVEATIEKVEDYGEIARLGVLKTPGLVIDGDVVSEGKVIAAKSIKKLIVDKR
ncbi:thioredoxin family protein [Halolactibacillus miurensis]|uniref:Small redox-active disulfide protein 2 n=1 Tax=Halolactibacillus miurensis TaxID=306541 RepID=A0A1I6S4R6_9BACI|nr:MULTISPECIES: thioredoxin family protein [Halolactibacillus]GEM04932.1 thioredoxin family protein [Halolactibacillus miurensis]SFS71758.1 small redox-active disulfide protein 2 [Halolactibacillus miurensis]